jgi:hypothetical protein
LKLAAIYNVFDGEELLEGSIKQIYDHVDLIIIVWQDVSNFGESYTPIFSEFIKASHKVIFKKYIPDSKNGFRNEINKRQIGINLAKEYECTHFISMDCDEYYDTEEFGNAKLYFTYSGFGGSVCKMWTYFKSPTYKLETPEGYYVPFIHELKSNTKTGVKTYPFYCDPTRRINESKVYDTGIMMHHFSWVRKDIGRKVRNSSAKSSFEKGTLLNDYYCTNLYSNPEGYYLKDFDKKITLVKNRFNISEEV